MTGLVPPGAPDRDRAAVRRAAAAWSGLVEPGDRTAGTLLLAVGPVAALAWLRAACEPGTRARAVARLRDRLEDAPDELSARRLLAAVDRWGPRLGRIDTDRDALALQRLGGRVLVRGDDAWPTGLDDLGPEAPACLWVRGDPAALAGPPAVALVGARAATSYGTAVAADLACGLADRGHPVVSGGAYGIDAAAHRGALAGDGPTVAVMAGGVDRLYPAGNTDLLERVLVRGGAVVAEVPVGATPTRSRFLRRNRLIAALASATVVVEAAWRSGSLSTASLAAGLLRPVGAVPGPVTSMASTGCHRLLREQDAVCVTSVADVLELLPGGAPSGPGGHGAGTDPQDGLGEAARMVVDGLDARRTSTLDELVPTVGLSAADVLAALGELELAGLVARAAGGWALTVTGRRPAAR
ncbi:DNA-processing protein DprA [Sanguibacter sp. HDW7]|uniref:DNA-processing protein DprA n=1 Tax=Sanguibacter sp. HDW7 TaxID=2714931 RepID=UPI001F116965|nr:DNA-processing protein DprA [Sanguibacter sp. HDW7]